MAQLYDIIDQQNCQLEDDSFITHCRATLDQDGVLTIPGFLKEEAISRLVAEAEAGKPDAFFTSSTHNVYLTPKRDDLADDHVCI